MKKMFVLLALCALATSLMAADKNLPFTEEDYKAGKLNVPVVYTGMLKINGWGDEGLCYNWQQSRTSFPLFLGLCQPCLDCVPCDIDMRHMKPVAQYGNWLDDLDNAEPKDKGGDSDYLDQTEAFFSRARLYIVTDIDTKDKDAEIVVVDLIDAYWGKDNKSMIPVMFQFFNTVDSDGSTTVKGRTGVFYQFPIYSREFDKKSLASKGNKTYGMSDYPFFNLFDTDRKMEWADTNNHGFDGDKCEVSKKRGEDGIGLVAAIGVKDSKSFFKVKNAYDKWVSMPIVTIKSFTGDFFAWQYNYTDYDLVDDDDLPQYVCRKGEEYVSYSGSDEDADGHNDPGYDGKGTWYATGSITLRRNDSVTKKMMEQLNKEQGKINCIPCNKTQTVPICRNYLDNGIVEFLIKKQYKNWKIDYIVDLDNDGIYGEWANNCGDEGDEYFEPVYKLNSKNEIIGIETDASKFYLDALVNISDKDTNLYNLPAASKQLAGEANKAKSAGRVLESDFYHKPSPTSSGK